MAKKKTAPKSVSIDHLWEPQKAYPFFPNTHSLINIYADIDSFLPYKRKYTNLTPGQLQELIRIARQNHWKALDLTDCGLTELPEELWTLTDLRILYLGSSPLGRSVGSDNCIHQLPRGIEKLKNLQVLSLWWPSLCTVQGSQPLNLPNLRLLELTGSIFSELPEAFSIPSLRELGLGYTHIR